MQTSNNWVDMDFHGASHPPTSHFVCCFVLRQGLTMWLWLPLNSQRSMSLPSECHKGMHHPGPHHNTEHWQDGAGLPLRPTQRPGARPGFLPPICLIGSLEVKAQLFQWLGRVATFSTSFEHSVTITHHLVYFLELLRCLQFTEFLFKIINILKLAGVNFILRHVKSQAEGIS